MLKRENYFFILWFLIVYLVLNFTLLKFFGKPVIGFWEWLIKIIFGNYFNYQVFVFVPLCSGLMSVCIFLSVLIAYSLAYKKKVKINLSFFGVLFLLMANFLRLILVLLSEKVSFLFAKVMHVLLWFGMGGLIFGLLLWIVRKQA